MAHQLEPSPAASALDRYRPMPLAEFIAADISPRRWAIEGIWPEGRSGIIAGVPKGGKSTLALELSVSLAGQVPFLGHFPVLTKPARVAYVQAENSTERVRRDLDAILCARGLGWMEDVYENREDGELIGQQFQWSTDWRPDLEVLSNPGMDLMSGDDQAWLYEYALDRDYIIADPSYLLASADPNSMRDVMELTKFLSIVRDGADCGLIFTHQMTNKHGDGDESARMLGSTMYAGWYEVGIFTRRNSAGFVNLHVDNLREMSETRDLGLQGLGVGSWFYSPAAQGALTVDGHRAPQTVAKQTNIERLRNQHEENPGWSYQQHADALGVGKSTVRDYFKEIGAEAADAQSTDDRADAGGPDV
jgi:hypothetical protein